MGPGIHAHINAYVLNAKFASRALADDVDRRSNPAKRRRYNFSTMYEPLADLKDYTIKRSEMLWMREGPGAHPALSEHQQPYVLSVLNGACVDDTKYMNIRVLGPSREDVIFDSGNVRKAPTGDPVVVLAAVKSLYNLGDEPVRPGDALEWYFPKPTHRNQINDGITTFNSKNRLCPGLRPLHITCNVNKLMRNMVDGRYMYDEAFTQVWQEFVDFTKLSKYLEADDPVFDELFRAIQEPIVEAYESHAGVATTGAAAGTKIDNMIGSPFLSATLDPVRADTQMKRNSKGYTPPPSDSDSDSDSDSKPKKVVRWELVPGNVETGSLGLYETQPHSYLNLGPNFQLSFTADELDKIRDKLYPENKPDDQLKINALYSDFQKTYMGIIISALQDASSVTDIGLLKPKRTRKAVDALTTIINTLANKLNSMLAADPSSYDKDRYTSTCQLLLRSCYEYLVFYQKVYENLGENTANEYIDVQAMQIATGYFQERIEKAESKVDRNTRRKIEKAEKLKKEKKDKEEYEKMQKRGVPTAPR